MSKVDPSFKSKRYRDKLRTEIKGLECLIPIDRSVLHRKLDSQTVFRLIISYFRIKVLFQSALGLHHNVAEEQATDNKTQDIPKDFFDGQNINQIMDGFLLVATTDGTILYTTENVLQYIGFNQVDLMHRCLYGLVHPDDHFDLKSTLESSLPLSPQDRSGCLGDYSKTHKDKYVSFICRMKCFNGSAAGYLKMHCSGRIQTIPNFPLKTNTGPLNVILLYCQPFMLTGSGCDVSNEVKQNVFWSKHDMDLKIKELDKKAEEMVGYEADELTDSSMYDVVHPEDLAAFAACHKALIESTEVKTMYFRMICKNGELMWLHSRGKVVSKNSKKFSIVFTHCPVREEDSTFLQQESVARQRYALHDLQCFLQFGHYANDHHPQCETDKTNFQKSGQHYTPHIGFTEDMSLSFYSSPTTCPSSWHAMSDRHSPVLPSTHVAHKITQKEKQLQFQEFRRRQQIQMQCNMQSNPFSFGLREDQEYTHEDHVENFKVTEKGSNNLFYLPEKQIKVEPRTENFDNPCVSNIPFGFLDQRHSNVCGPTQCGHFDNYVTPYHSCYHTQGNIIPNVSSTVASPQQYTHFTLPFHQNYKQEHSPTNFISYQGIPVTNENFRHSGGLHFIRQDTGSMNTCQISPHMSDGNGNTHYIRKFIKPQANIKLSMHCDYSHPTNGQSFQIPVETKYRPLQETITRPRTQTGLTIDGKSCAVNTGHCPPEEVIQYDIEASIHMKIVDNSSSKFRETTKSDPDLPSIGSFLEYLNDA